MNPEETSWKHYLIKENDDESVFARVMICDNGDDEKYDSLQIDNIEQFRENFSGYYSKMYFEKEDKSPKGLNVSKSEIESEIMKITEKNKWTRRDIFQILAWKTGNIKYNDSTPKNIKYSDNWKCDEKNENGEYAIQLFRQTATAEKDFGEFADKVVGIKEKYEKNKDEKKAWKELVNINTIKGIGTVYLITILFFMTRGKFPIYDRFAMASLIILGLCEEKKLMIPANPECKSIIVQIKALPGKDNIEKTKMLINNLSSTYNMYKKYLNKFFGDNWKGVKEENRKIDRALWVYGHYFEVIDL